MLRETFTVGSLSTAARAVRPVASAYGQAAVSAIEWTGSQAQRAVIDRLPRKPIDLGQAEAAAPSEIDWDRADRLATYVGGLAAGLVDVLIVGTPTPKPMRLSPCGYPGSPITRWLHPDRHLRAKKFFEQFETPNLVPYDARYGADVRDAVDHMGADDHRERSLAHDPVLGLPIGIFDNVTGKGTYSKAEGGVTRARPDTYRPPEGRSLLRKSIDPPWLAIKHLASDWYTSAGLPMPFFTIIPLLPLPAMLAPAEPDEISPFAGLAQGMYADGYELRHFLTSATVPLTTEIVIRTYWRMTASVRPPGVAHDARLATMLMEGHAIAMVLDGAKVAFVFKGEATAFNWAQALYMPVAAALTARKRRRS